MQSVAALQFLPKVDRHIDREMLNDETLPSDANIKIILNGWFCHRPDRWPPADCIAPLLVSLHVTNNPEPGSGVRAREEFARMPTVLSYLRANGPIGARDLSTLEWLELHDVPAYYSGCLTLTLDRPPVGRGDFIVANDVHPHVLQELQRRTSRQILRTTHKDVRLSDAATRLAQANALLETYASATCVVTSRLHCALPCLAVGTPVLLVDTSWDQSRFTGLNELVHHCPWAEFVSGDFEYCVENPRPNPQRHLVMREELIATVRRFVGRQESFLH